MQQDFKLNLSVALAHSVVFFTREHYSPNGVVDDARNGGDPPAQSVAASTNEQLNALATYLPTLIHAAGDNVPYLENALYESRAAISPKDNALQLKLLQDYGPAFNKVGSEIAGANQRAQVTNDTSAIQAAIDSGLIDKVTGLDRTVNPEFYSTRAQAAKSLSDLLGSYDLTGLSGSERAEVERSVNRNNNALGNDGVGSPLRALDNASQFGSALERKRQSLGGAIDRASTFLPASRTNIDPFMLATGRSSGANSGESKFGGTSSNTGAASLGLTNNLLGQTGENLRTGMTIDSQRRDELDRVNETISSLPSYS